VRNRTLYTCDREVSGGRGNSLAVFHLALVGALVGFHDVADGQSDDAVRLVVVQSVSLGGAYLLLVLEPLDGRRRRGAVLGAERHRSAGIGLVVRSKPLYELRSYARRRKRTTSHNNKHYKSRPELPTDLHPDPTAA